MKRLWILSIIIFLTGCGNISNNTQLETKEIAVIEDSTNVVSIGYYELNPYKYRDYRHYDDSLTYTVPEDTPEWVLKDEKSYYKYLKKSCDAEDFDERWNFHLWCKYYRPDDYFIDYKEGTSLVNDATSSHYEWKEATPDPNAGMTDYIIYMIPMFGY